VASLRGRTAVVTGSGQGIGREIALLLAEEGAAVITNSRSPENTDGTPTAIDTADAITEAGRAAHAVCADVGTMDGASQLINAALEHYGSADIIVNSAGVYPSVPVEEMSEETWDHVIAVNLTGSFAMAHLALPHMRAKGWGRIINLISRAGLAGAPGLGAYSAAKAGVTGLSFALAKEQQDAGITVNCVAPSATTERVRRTAAERQAHTGLVAVAPRSPADIAPLVVYLAGEEAADITGQIFYASGGEITLYAAPTPSRTLIKQGRWELGELAQTFPEAFAARLRPPEFRSRD
jgi:NAD(P)-dependent dehydrogenase (short-subunit alcohol dehydrogenase family)